MEVPTKLKEYIDNNRAPLPPIGDPDEPLQIDSLGLIRLVAFLESDLGIRIEDEELLAENLLPCGRSALCWRRSLRQQTCPSFDHWTTSALAPREAAAPFEHLSFAAGSERGFGRC